MRKLKLLAIGIMVAGSSYGGTPKNDSLVFNYLDSISVMLDSLQVEEPIYVMAQAVYESGWFQCKNCSWSYNNMFGFKARNGSYLKFKTWQDCVIYYSEWQKKRYPKYKSSHPNGTYLGFLKWCHYATGDDYNRQIQWTHDWIVKHWQKK